MGRLRPPLATCEAVLTEASFLLSRVGEASVIPQLVSRGLLTIEKLFDEEAERVETLMRRYRNVPMSFADACVVRLVERGTNRSLLTLDSDFRIYRQRGRRLIPVLMP